MCHWSHSSPKAGWNSVWIISSGGLLSHLLCCASLIWEPLCPPGLLAVHSALPFVTPHPSLGFSTQWAAEHYISYWKGKAYSNKWTKKNPVSVLARPSNQAPWGKLQCKLQAHQIGTGWSGTSVFDPWLITHYQPIKEVGEASGESETFYKRAFGGSANELNAFLPQGRDKVQDAFPLTWSLGNRALMGPLEEF